MPQSPLAVSKPVTPRAYAVERAVTAWKAFAASPAQEYARRRGVPDHLAAALHLGYWKGMWQGEDSQWLTFPLRCPVSGAPVGVYGRNLRSDEQGRKGRILGPRGLFGAAGPGPQSDEVVLVEGPFEAQAVLASPGLPPARPYRLLGPGRVVRRLPARARRAGRRPGGAHGYAAACGRSGDPPRAAGHGAASAVPAAGYLAAAARL